MSNDLKTRARRYEEILETVAQRVYTVGVGKTASDIRSQPFPDVPLEIEPPTPKTLADRVGALTASFVELVGRIKKRWLKGPGDPARANVIDALNWNQLLASNAPVAEKAVPCLARLVEGLQYLAGTELRGFLGAHVSELRTRWANEAGAHAKELVHTLLHGTAPGVVAMGGGGATYADKLEKIQRELERDGIFEAEGDQSPTRRAAKALSSLLVLLPTIVREDGTLDAERVGLTASLIKNVTDADIKHPTPSDTFDLETLRSASAMLSYLRDFTIAYPNQALPS